jgi:hypothetical protein
MKKFTSTTNTILREKKQPLLNKTISNLISENISIKGEDTLEGKDKLIQNFQSLLTQEKETTKTRVLESVKSLSFQNLNFFDINNRIDLYLFNLKLGEKFEFILCDSKIAGTFL